MRRSTRCFAAPESVFTPYFNRWNRDAYRRFEPFDEHPWQVSAGSTSGAAVAIAREVFVGLLTPDPTARFFWDGQELVIEADTDHLFVAHGTDRVSAWNAFHEQIGKFDHPAPWGRLPEYCAWVEQVARKAPNELPGEVMSVALVDELLASVDDQQWPRGRFTVDEGWGPRHGPDGYGTWNPRAGFDPVAVAIRIAAADHIPGLWLAPALICPDSAAAHSNPDLIGAQVNMGAETPWNHFHYLRPGLASAELIRELFARVWDWGFRKVKLDIFYGPRCDMLALAQQCREAARALPGLLELEGHVPDPLIAKHFDVIRVNDVLVGARHQDWRKVVNSHFEVCSTSAPDHLLCLDHIGGNDSRLSESEFIEHCALMQAQLPRGYPVVGLWPTRLGQNAAAHNHATADRIHRPPPGPRFHGSGASLIRARSPGRRYSSRPRPLRCSR